MDSKDNKNGISKGRRDALKTLITIPACGVLAYGAYKKAVYTRERKEKANFFDFKKTKSLPAAIGDKVVRVGIIGFGIRGKMLMRGLGFAEPSWVESMYQANQKNPKDTRYEQFLKQDKLNVEITGVCDIFDVYAEAAMKAGANVNRERTEKNLKKFPKRYRTYQEMIASDEIDAIVIAAPDHWHSTMVTDAAKAGKHVYCEKPLSWTVPETYRVREAVKQNHIAFQLGHQGRQTDSYTRAKEIVDQGLLGNISLIEVCTNRNTPNGAWVYKLIDGASPKTIDWKQFMGPDQAVKEYMDYMTSNKLEKYIGPDERDKFSLERFFRWRCWWDYSTGLSGDLLTHEYDAINQIMEVGIPDSATSSGGIYVFKDGRTVPDVLQTTFEFARGTTMLYSATLGSSRNRGKVIMGSDASLEISNILEMKADRNSIRYKDKIKEGLIKPNETFYTYIPGSDSVDALTSPTEIYFAKRGLLYTYVGGKRYDTTHLHLREWLACVRDGGTPSCNIDRAFEEAITAHMGTRAYLEGRTMYWDRDKELIVKG